MHVLILWHNYSRGDPVNEGVQQQLCSRYEGFLNPGQTAYCPRTPTCAVCMASTNVNMIVELVDPRDLEPPHQSTAMLTTTVDHIKDDQNTLAQLTRTVLPAGHMLCLVQLTSCSVACRTWGCCSGATRGRG